MSYSRSTSRNPDPTGVTNRWAAIGLCLILAAICAFQAWQADAYTRALDTEGMTVQGSVIEHSLRPCELGDFCLRRRSSNLTHVGSVTIRYPDPSGRSLIIEKSINNETARDFQRYKRVSVSYPASDAQNASVGDAEFNRRGRLLRKVLYALGFLALIGGAFWIQALPSSEFEDEHDWSGHPATTGKRGLDRFLNFDN